ncbi:hypothetical protein [Myxacorys almedinensis]|uniref:Uncharacterized protein n=1 Tax=Myxacorys almedinensis A TaxID=2690445 RepID=A0A8J7YXX7_9CYAN|nr:hypothetical protein [Myxacorys almedinensis]NDJ16589.1 hypothetical protein [Myxacorys almedinensis A]
MSSWRTSSPYLLAGVISALVPTLVFAALPHQATAKPALVAQSSAESESNAYQIYQTPELGFRIAYPKGYTVDTSNVGEGYLRFVQPASAPEAEATQPTTKAESGGQAGSIVAAAFDNPTNLSALAWAQQNGEKSFFETGRQSNYQSRKFAGQDAIAYSWCATECGDSVVFPSRDGKRIIVLSAVYDLPGDAVRWDFQNTIGKFRFMN